MTGIPEGALAAGYAHGSGASRARAAPRAPVSSSDPLAALRTHSQLNELKTIIRNDPTKMPDVLKVIGGASPAFRGRLAALHGAPNDLYFVGFSRIFRMRASHALPPPPLTNESVESSPDILTAINGNKEAFLALMREDIVVDDEDGGDDDDDDGGMDEDGEGSASPTTCSLSRRGVPSS